MNHQTIVAHPDHTVSVLDQRILPHITRRETLRSVDDCIEAIADMWVRGAPLIGVTAAFGMAFAAQQFPNREDLKLAAGRLADSRPTAVNLAWAIKKQLNYIVDEHDPANWFALLWKQAEAMLAEDADACRMIGVHGLPMFEEVYARTGKPVQVLTHCNAGALACVAWGTATAPMYMAHAKGIPIHVWVDETRPRNQGAHLTAWELGKAGIPHTVITDNAGGHLMQHGQVDLVITGADRVAANGDAANKIGTYLKALAAKDNDIPFYVALPMSTYDAAIKNGLQDIPIEERSAREVSHIQGWDEGEQQVRTVRLTPADSPAANPAFDVTPARLITSLITDTGVFAPGKM
ncbi:MAG: S-methyl-5-thioribose-1-phosphate isomerase [Bacteroidia bacterium]